MSDRIDVGHRLDGGDRLALDLPTLIDTRMLIQGNSGAGKSRLLRRIAEQAHGRVQMVILDPEGEFSTLREKHDFLLVGQGGEVPAEIRSARLLARRLLELRVSAVVDLYELRLDQRRMYVREFLEALLALPKELYRPLLVALDEAHLFVPERSAGESCATESVIALMSQGRKRGLCGVLLTQRLSKLHKDAAAECNNVAIGRTWLDVDQVRAAQVLGISEKERNELRHLRPGEFRAFGPAFQTDRVVQFQAGDVATTHPTAGKRHKLEPPEPSAAIRKVLVELSDLPEQAAEEIRTLQAAQEKNRTLALRIRELERAVPPPPPAPKAPKVVHVPVMKDEHVKRLETVIATAQGKMAGEFSRVIDALGRAALAREATLRAPESMVPAPAPRLSATQFERPSATSSGRPAPARGEHATRPSGGNGKMGKAERMLLTALAWRYPRTSTKAQVSILSGYSIKSSSFDNALSALRTAGFMRSMGNELEITSEGFEALGPYPPRPTSGEVIQWWNGKLGKAERILLGVAVRSGFEKVITKEQLSEASGYSINSSSFDNAISKLATLELIERMQGGVRANPDLLRG